MAELERFQFNNNDVDFSTVDRSEINVVSKQMHDEFYKGKSGYDRLTKLIVEAHDAAINGYLSGMTNMMKDMITMFGRTPGTLVEAFKSLGTNLGQFSASLTPKYQELQSDIQNWLYNGPYQDAEYAAKMCGFLMKLAGYVKADSEKYYEHAFSLKNNELEKAAGIVLERMEKVADEEHQRKAKEEYNRNNLDETTQKRFDELGDNAASYRTQVESIVKYDSDNEVDEEATRIARQEKINNIYNSIFYSRIVKRTEDIQTRFKKTMSDNGWEMFDNFIGPSASAGYYAVERAVVEAKKGYYVPQQKLAFPYVDMSDGKDGRITDFRYPSFNTQKDAGAWFTDSTLKDAKSSEEKLISIYNSIKEQYGKTYSALDSLFETVKSETDSLIKDMKGLDILSGNLGTGDCGWSKSFRESWLGDMDYFYTGLAVFDSSNVSSFDTTLQNIKTNYENAMASYELYKENLKIRAGEYNQLQDEATVAFEKFEKQNKKLHDLVNEGLPEYLDETGLTRYTADDYVVSASGAFRERIMEYDPDDYSAGLEYYRKEAEKEHEKIWLEEKKSEYYQEALLDYAKELSYSFGELLIILPDGRMKIKRVISPGKRLQ